jgi:hypothetical protein
MDWLQLAMIAIETLTVDDLHETMPAKAAKMTQAAVELHCLR